MTSDHPILSIKTLQELQLSFEFQALPNFLESISGLRSLRQLKFTLHSRYPVDPKPPHITGILKDLSEVLVDIRVWMGRVLDSEGGLPAIMAILIDSLVIMAPNLRHLTIKSTAALPLNIILQSAQNFQHMETLKFRDIEETKKSMGSSRIQFPSLRNLHVQSRQSLVNIIKGIHAPKLQELHVDCHLRGLSTRLETPFLTSLGISTDSISLLHNINTGSLKSLEWRCSPQFQQSTSVDISAILEVRSLKRLILLDAQSRREHELLLVSLIQQPHSLPHLQKLRFDYYPSFALLLRFLLRRNVVIHTQNPRVTQINAIDFPGLPAFSILRPLTRLLGGYCIAPSEFLSADDLDRDFWEDDW
jgi:hypothetical protein